MVEFFTILFIGLLLFFLGLVIMLGLGVVLALLLSPIVLVLWLRKFRETS